MYKKGVMTEAVNYGPIFVNPLMYLAFMKIVFWRYAAEIMQSLDEYQYVVKGRTTTMQCLNLVHAVTALGSVWKDGFVCKLDVLGATSSIVPHDETARTGQKFAASLSRITGIDNMHLSMGTKQVEWTTKR